MKQLVRLRNEKQHPVDVILEPIGEKRVLSPGEHINILLDFALEPKSDGDLLEISHGDGSIVIYYTASTIADWVH